MYAVSFESTTLARAFRDVLLSIRDSLLPRTVDLAQDVCVKFVPVLLELSLKRRSALKSLQWCSRRLRSLVTGEHRTVSSTPLRKLDRLLVRPTETGQVVDALEELLCSLISAPNSCIDRLTMVIVLQLAELHLLFNAPYSFSLALPHVSLDLRWFRSELYVTSFFSDFYGSFYDAASLCISTPHFLSHFISQLSSFKRSAFRRRLTHLIRAVDEFTALMGTSALDVASAEFVQASRASFPVDIHGENAYLLRWITAAFRFLAEMDVHGGLPIIHQQVKFPSLCKDRFSSGSKYTTSSWKRRNRLLLLFNQYVSSNSTSAASAARRCCSWRSWSRRRGPPGRGTPESG